MKSITHALVVVLLFALRHSADSAEPFSAQKSPSTPADVTWTNIQQSLAKKKFAEAYTPLQTFSARFPADPRVPQSLYWKGLCEMKQGRASMGLNTWNLLLVNHPDGEPAANALEQMSIYYESSHQTNKVDAIVSKMLASLGPNPVTGRTLLSLGQMAFDGKDYPRATERWEQFLNLFPQDPRVTGIQKKMEIARAAPASGSGANGESQPDALLRRADSFFDRAAFAQALPAYEQMVEKFPLSERIGHAAGRLAQCQFALGQRKEAIDTLQRTAERTPSHAPELLTDIVVQAASRRDADPLRIRATQFLLDRYASRFETQQAVFIAGWVESIRNNPPGAEKWWTLLLDRYPQTPFRAAVEKRFKPRPQLKAERVLPFAEMKPAAAINQPAKQTPKPGESPQKKQSEQRARWQQQASQLELASRLPDANPSGKVRTMFQLAEQRFYLRQFEPAVQQYRRIWEEFPESDLSDQAAFRAAQVRFSSGQPHKGVEQLQFLADQFPESKLRPLTLYCLGNRHILYEGNLKKAWASYEQLMTDYPDHPLTERARQFWAKVSALPPDKLREQVERFLAKHTTQNGS